MKVHQIMYVVNEFEQIGNIVVKTKERLEKENDYNVEKHRELVRKELEEMEYEEEIITEWLEYI